LQPRDLLPGEVRLRVLACGVGLTVLNAIRGDLRGDREIALPRVPGHEICGEVIEVAPDVRQLRRGDRGVVYFYLTCGSCWYCATGREPLCERLAGFVGVDVDGGYADEAIVPARNLVPIPHGLDPAGATAIPDAIATPVHVCETRASVRPGEIVAVVGAGGGVGIHLVQVAIVYGARVVAIDVTDEKRSLALATGAELAFGPGVEPAEIVRRAGRAPDVVVDTVGSAETFEWSLTALGRGGRLVVLTTFPGSVVAASAPQLVFDEAALIGSRYASYADVRLAIRLVADGSVRPVIGAIVPLARVEELHARLRERSLPGRGAVVC
jgi:D-arabinose 1-dehydrogenase-like Zn-dependent alcohol dehydrogenase